LKRQVDRNKTFLIVHELCEGISFICPALAGAQCAIVRVVTSSLGFSICHPDTRNLRIAVSQPTVADSQNDRNERAG
jgi:hypothetical protein